MSYLELKESPPSHDTQQAPLVAGKATAGYQSGYPLLDPINNGIGSGNGGPGHGDNTAVPKHSVLNLEGYDEKIDGEDKLSDDADIFQGRYENLEFESCFFEHKSTRSIPIVYKINEYIFKYTKLFVYNFFVIMIGFLISFIYAILLGSLSFVLVWLYTPFFRGMMYASSRFLPAVFEPLKILLIPLIDAHARLFRQIRVKSWLNGSLMTPLAAKTDTNKTA